MPRRAIRRVFYACGPGDTIRAHRAWQATQPDETQISSTFSGEVADFVEALGARGYFVSQHPRKGRVWDERFVIEHLPKPWPRASGLAYHLRELLYAAALALKAYRYRCDLAIIESGTTHPFACVLFRALGVRSVYVMHNTRWPRGRRPRSLTWRLIHRLDGVYLSRVADAVLGVSPECLRQATELSGRRQLKTLAFMPRYEAGRLASVAPPPPHDRGPFHVVFVGRLTRDKGVLDIPVAARLVDAALPGRVAWSIWGVGDAEAALHASIAAEGVARCVRYRGWAAPDRIADVYREVHLSVVPTRSSFAEGLAMTVIEAVALQRPVVASSVVPAAEVMDGACVVVPADDPRALAHAVIGLAGDRAAYEALQRHCGRLAPSILSHRAGLRDRLLEAVVDG